MFKRAVSVSMALIAGLLVGVVASPASGQTLSPGCQYVNQPSYDSMYTGYYPGWHDFSAGEQITVTASTPTTVNDPTTLTLYVDWTAADGWIAVDTTGFPGTVSYTFPADASFVPVGWSVDKGNATFTVSCQLAPPLPTSAEQCKKGGYEVFNFENQGDCVSFVATEGSNEPGQNVPNT